MLIYNTFPLILDSLSKWLTHVSAASVLYFQSHNPYLLTYPSGEKRKRNKAKQNLCLFRSYPFSNVELWRDRGKKEAREAEQLRGLQSDSSPTFNVLKRKIFPPLALPFWFPFIFLAQNWNQGHVNFMIASIINSWVLHKCIFMYILLPEQTSQQTPSCPLTPLSTPIPPTYPHLPTEVHHSLPTLPSLAFS